MFQIPSSCPIKDYPHFANTLKDVNPNFDNVVFFHCIKFFICKIQSGLGEVKGILNHLIKIDNGTSNPH